MGEENGRLPRIDFAAETERCPRCGGAVRAYKSRVRTVVTLAQGAFEAREALKRCVNGAPCPVLRSEELSGLVEPRKRHGYDLMVQVGLSRYLEGRQREEIRTRLREQQGIELSAGTISNLCDRFLLRLEALHLLRAPALRAEMEGGYPLHLDATCEKGRGGLFVCLDGWRGWVLGSARIPTENELYLRPVVEKVVGLFGDPVAIVRDLGESGARAVAPLRNRGVPDLVCHYHFLAAVGKKLFKKPHVLIRELVRQSSIRSELRALLRELRRYRQSNDHQGNFGTGYVREDLLALVYWLLEGSGEREAAFPFSLPHLDFVRRCRETAHRAPGWIPPPRTEPERRVVQRLRRLTARLGDPRIDTAARTLDDRWQAFRELRSVLRLSNAELPGGDALRHQALLPAMELLRLHQIEQDVTRYKRELLGRVAAGAGARKKRQDNRSAHTIILRYLQRYGAHLFGHPARRDRDAFVSAVVERTNNRLEHLFGREKQQLRRRVGRAHLARDMQQQPAQAALVSNLRRPDYVRVLCGSLENLPSAFAALHGQLVEGTSPLARDHRDKRLQRRVHELLKADSKAAAHQHVDADIRHGEAQDSPDDLFARLADLKGTTERELRARCAGLFGTQRAPGLPPVGNVMTRIYNGIEHQVTVLEDGFEYQSERYTSLARLTMTITRGKCANSRTFFGVARPNRDPRLPPVGQTLTRIYQGKKHQIRVLEKGFEYQGRHYRSLSRIAYEITDTSWNGYLFFGLTTRRPPARDSPQAAAPDKIDIPRKMNISPELS